MDQVVTMTELKADDGAPYRAFVCSRPNPWNYPAGDRSGKLDMIEQPHLGGLMEKIYRGERKAISSYTYNLKG